MPKLRVRELAQSRGLNLSQLQRRADIAMRTARRYWFNTQSGNVAGEPLKEVSFDVLQSIASVLGVTAKDLIENGEAQP
jgi:transcriptional regulator with XRE-family HTH domain